MNSSAEFVPRDRVVIALRRWWVIVLAVLVGGLAGLAIHTVRPPVFEARFEVLLGLDQVGSGELERFEEDTALDAAGLILGGPETLRQVAEAARQEGLDVQPEDLARMATLERRRSTWMVRLRGPDAKELELLTSIWLRTSFQALEQAYEHTSRAASARRALASLESCLARTAHSSPAEGLCGAGNLAELQAEMQRIGETLAQEQKSAHGLESFVLVGSAEKAVVPPQAVANGRGALALAGALIGLAVGIWISQVAVPRKQER